MAHNSVSSSPEFPSLVEVLSRWWLIRRTALPAGSPLRGASAVTRKMRCVICGREKGQRFQTSASASQTNHDSNQGIRRRSRQSEVGPRTTPLTSPCGRTCSPTLRRFAEAHFQFNVRWNTYAHSTLLRSPPRLSTCGARRALLARHYVQLWRQSRGLRNDGPRWTVDCLICCARDSA